MVTAASEVVAKDQGIIRSKRVLFIEDAPTITHGGMAYGTGFVAAKKYGASEIVDPRPFAVGSIKEMFLEVQTHRQSPACHGILP